MVFVVEEKSLLFLLPMEVEKVVVVDEKSLVRQFLPR
jgi:hypothetical protein